METTNGRTPLPALAGDGEIILSLTVRGFPVVVRVTAWPLNEDDRRKVDTAVAGAEAAYARVARMTVEEFAATVQQVHRDENEWLRKHRPELFVPAR